MELPSENEDENSHDAEVRDMLENAIQDVLQGLSTVKDHSSDIEVREKTSRRSTTEHAVASKKICVPHDVSVVIESSKGQTTIKPGNEAGDRKLVYPTKTTFQKVKSFSGVGQPVDFKNTRAEVLCRTLGGGIDLIWVDQGSDEAFIQPLMAVFFGPPQPTSQKTRDACGFICSVPRRIAKEMNEPMYKITSKGQRYKKSYFVRFRGEGPDEQQRLQTSLRGLCQVRLWNGFVRKYYKVHFELVMLGVKK